MYWSTLATKKWSLTKYDGKHGNPSPGKAQMGGSRVGGQTGPQRNCLKSKQSLNNEKQKNIFSISKYLALEDNFIVCVKVLTKKNILQIRFQSMCLCSPFNAELFHSCSPYKPWLAYIDTGISLIIILTGKFLIKFILFPLWNNSSDWLMI